MARWAGVHLGTVEVSEQFARVAQRSHENNHTVRNPFADTDFVATAGWNVLLVDDYFVDGKIMHAGSTFGYIAYVGLVPERDMAIVMLTNVRNANVAGWLFLLWDAVDGHNFNSIGADLFAILDIVFVAVIAVGVVFIGLFVWRAVKLGKWLGNGGKCKPKFRVRWLIGPVLSVFGVLIFYVVAPMLFAMPFGMLVLLSPASTHPAAIAMWIIAAYSLFSLLTKIYTSGRRDGPAHSIK